jgi:hypothetical protein
VRWLSATPNGRRRIDCPALQALHRTAKTWAAVTVADSIALRSIPTFGANNVNAISFVSQAIIRIQTA